jgi:uncharacterized YigZ family protein|tara:strand:+ start:158 stop:775 length:618 start_codon:yes stop_codon:yes gene_type:complete
VSEIKDSYKTIKTPSEGFFKDRGSKFFGYAYPITSEQELKLKIEELKKEHHTARHHCYAYRLKQDYSVYRANDDGEPTNAAGKPILGQIDAKELTNVGVVVVRYFGGTKLGVGGMMNAYKTAALEALNNAEIIECTIDEEFEISFGYPEMNTVMRFIKDLGLEIKSQKMEMDCKIIFAIRKKEAQKAQDKFTGLKNISIKKVDDE